MSELQTWRGTVVLAVLWSAGAAFVTWQAVRDGGERWIVAGVWLAAAVTWVAVAEVRRRRLRSGRGPSARA